MSVRFLFRGVQLPSTTLLAQYWGSSGYFRPDIDLYLVGPNGNSITWTGQIDTSSDWVVFDNRAAVGLGLRQPFPRVVPVSGIAGAVQAQFTMPPDGTVSLFVTDYHEYYFLPTPPVGFWPPSPTGAQRPNVLGVTGFLQYFQVNFHYQLSRPEVELIHHDPGFAGGHGQLPPGVVLQDFIRGLKFPP
jgi:hypothetical protein